MAGERYFIGPGLRDKLRETIIRVDEIRRVDRGASAKTALQDGMGGRGGRVFRIGTFSGEWQKGSSKTVTFKFVTATPNTVSATNLFAQVPSRPGKRDCAIAKDGTAWFLIATEC